jgi:hypothetical protein
MGLSAGSFGVQPENGIRLTEFRPDTPFLQAQDLTPILTFSDGQSRAGSWLRENSSVQDLIATNITFSPIVAALSWRQTFISGVSHQAPYGRTAFLGEILEREQISLAFINSPSKETFETLCTAGVDWVWVDRDRTETMNWSPFAEIAFDSLDTVILRSISTSC